MDGYARRFQDVMVYTPRVYIALTDEEKTEINKELDEVRKRIKEY